MTYDAASATARGLTRRAFIEKTLAVSAGVSVGGVAAAYAMPVSTTPNDPLFGPICRTATTETVTDPVGSPRHVRFAYNGTGICTAAIPVALHRGYFARHNLDVEFLQLAGTTDQMLQALATDKADAGASMLLSWLKPLEQGIDVKLTTGLHGGCTRLFVPKAAGLSDIAQLKGKTIGVSSISGSPRNFFAILLAKHGIDPESEVQWREFPADLLPTALQRGEVQAIADADPTAWLIQKRSNETLVEIASNLSEHYAHLSCCTLGIKRSLVEQDRATAAALTAAVREGSIHVAEHPEDAAEIFSKYTPKVPVEDLLAMLRSHTHSHHPAGAALRQEVAQITGDLKLARIVKPSTDPDKFAGRVVVDVLG